MANQVERGTAQAVTRSVVASLDTVQTLIAANPSRKGLLVTNSDANALRVCMGGTATASVFDVVLRQNDYWEMPEPLWTGAITGIWDANGSGSAYISEIT